MKDRARDRPQNLHLAGELRDHRRHAVCARFARPGGQPLADLALGHRDPAGDASAAPRSSSAARPPRPRRGGSRRPSSAAGAARRDRCSSRRPSSRSRSRTAPTASRERILQAPVDLDHVHVARRARPGTPPARPARRRSPARHPRRSAPRRGRSRRGCSSRSGSSGRARGRGGSSNCRSRRRLGLDGVVRRSRRSAAHLADRLAHWATSATSPLTSRTRARRCAPPWRPAPRRRPRAARR